MNNCTIVDTSIWIEYFRNNPEIAEFIEKGLHDGTIYITGPILTELLQGARTRAELEKLYACIDAIPYLDCTVEEWMKAGEISFQLRKQGYAIPLTDVIISSVAINNNMKILTRDKHFKLIPGVELLKNS